MEAIKYIIIMILSSGLLFLYYWIFLRNKSFHRFNRFYLIANLSLPIIIPLVHLNLESIPKAVLINKNSLNQIPDWIKREQSGHDIHWEWILWALSLSVSIFLLIRFIIGIHKIYKIRKGLIIKPLGDYNLLFMETHQAPFSFMKDIYWSNKFSIHDLEGRRILDHEICHIREGHTYDKLYSQVLICFLWMNPFYYLIDGELSLIHEFIADEVSFPDRDVQFFAYCLLKFQVHFQNLLFTQSFFQSPIKRRLTMIKNSKTTRFALLRMGFAIPFAFILISFFSIQKLEANNVSGIHTVLYHFNKMDQERPIDTTNKKIIRIKIKEKNGKKTRFFYVKDSLITGKDTSKDYVIIRNSKGQNVENRIRNENKEVNIVVNDTLITRDESSTSDFKNSLVIINGKEAKQDDLKIVAPNQIVKIEVYKGDEAVKKYGKRGRKGVVVITLKDN